MEFFDKKQDVINLKLTRYGRQLLSVGEFEPVYYAFSDDGIIYDTRWVSGSSQPEEQWMVEKRIQEETPRIETLNSKVGAERTIFNTADISSYALEKNIIDLFNLGTDPQDLEELEEYKTGRLKLDPDFADNEKLLINLLGQKRYFNNKAPAWNVLFYNGEISASARTYQHNGIAAPIPQISSSFKDTIYRVPPEMDIYTVEPTMGAKLRLALGPEEAEELLGAQNATLGLDLAHHDVAGDLDALEELVWAQTLVTGSIAIEKDFLFISFEEANVDFEEENFLLEVYEVTETDDIQGLKKMTFNTRDDEEGTLTADAVADMFDIRLDAEINDELACFYINKTRDLKTKNIYTTDVFDCGGETLPGEASSGLYDLDPVETEDIC
jgi:hypothetical protein